MPDELALTSVPMKMLRGQLAQQIISGRASRISALTTSR